MLSFSFYNRSQAHFLLFLEPKDKRKVSQRNLYCCSDRNSCFKNLFPHSRSVKLKERDTVNSTANLSTWRHLTNQSMIPESGIMEQRHQKHVSRLRRPFPLPRPPLGSLRSPIFFLFDPVFCLFPPLRSLVPGYYCKQRKSVLHEFFVFTFEGRCSFS